MSEKMWHPTAPEDVRIGDAVACSAGRMKIVRARLMRVDREWIACEREVSALRTRAAVIKVSRDECPHRARVTGGVVWRITTDTGIVDYISAQEMVYVLR